MSEILLAERRDALQNVPIAEVDVRNGWDTESQREVFLDSLTKLGIVNANDLLRGFDAVDLKVLLREGRENLDSPDFFAMTLEQAINRKKGNRDDFFDYALDYEKPAVAIYDGARLINPEDDSRDEVFVPVSGQTFKSALKAVCTIKI